MENESIVHRIRTGFSPLFWIGNTLEIFERLAFYGSKAVLSFYLANKIGLGVTAAASLAGLFSGLVYGLPIVAGVFVDRFGFRKTLATCFSVFAVGYFLIGLGGMPQGQGIVESVGKTTYVSIVLLLTAVGGSLIKPCIVGTVERTSKPDYRALGFSIYYALVNLGGAIGPIIATFVRSSYGIEFVFVMSACTSAALVGGTLLFFREPVAAEPVATRTFGRLFGDMLLVFGNLRFMSFLVIFSGFYIMFWQTFYSLPFYVTEVLHFDRFEVLETVDAWTIILLSIPLTAFAKKIPAIQAMTLAFLISSVSWLILAFSHTVGACIAGLFLFAAGESILAPRLYDYVGLIAPRQQLGTFMGFAFLPVAIGSILAGRLAGWLVQHFMREGAGVTGMWITVAVVGFVSTALMVAYDQIVKRSTKTAAVVDA